MQDLGLPPGLVAAALGRVAESDDVYIAGDRMLVVSSAPARVAGPARSVRWSSLRDHTELRAVTGELDVVRGLTESLRSQNHEAANRLHTVVSLIEMGRPDDAVEFATDELQMAQQLTDRVVGAVGDPVLAALLLGKTAQAAERGIDLTIEGDLPRRRRRAARPRPGDRGRQPRRQRHGRGRPARDRAPGRRALRGRRRRGSGWSVGDSGPGLDRRRRPGTPSSAAGPPRPRPATAAAGSGWPWSAGSAHRYGGEVTIGDSPLGGAEFTVALRTPSAPDRSRMTVRVLVVEDEEVAAEAHAAYTARRRGVRGRRHRPLGRRRRPGSWRRTTRVDLILLDLHLPDGHGLALLPKLRASGRVTDVIAVTSARDAEVVRHAVAHGVVLYLLKPFTFATFRAKLQQYADYRATPGGHPRPGRPGRGRPAARVAAAPRRRQGCPRG